MRSDAPGGARAADTGTGHAGPCRQVFAKAENRAGRQTYGSPPWQRPDASGGAVKHLGAQLHRLANGFAIGGGFVLAAMVVLVVVSILGRALLSSPVPGDFEIVALGTAVAIFLFLPYCYMQKGNVAVDIFISRMPAGVQRAMDAFAAALFGAVAALLAWRSAFGLADTVRNGDISMILGFPVWVVHPFGVASFALLAVCCFYTAAAAATRTADATAGVLRTDDPTGERPPGSGSTGAAAKTPPDSGSTGGAPRNAGAAEEALHGSGMTGEASGDAVGKSPGGAPRNDANE